MKIKNYFLVLLLFGGLLTPPLTFAGNFSANLEFSTTGQSMWGPGGASVVSDFDEFYGVSWDTGKVRLGGIADGWFGSKWGAEVRGKTNGEIRFQVTIDQWNIGSVNVDYPVGITFDFPDPGIVLPGETFTLTSSYTNTPGASLTTNFPEANFNIDAVFQVYATIGATACVGGCFVDADVELINVNERTSVFSSHTGSTTVIPLPAGTGRIEGNWPDVDTTGTLVDGTLVASGSDSVLNMEIDLDRVVTNALALPSLEGELLGISYNVLDVQAGYDIAVAQYFLFDPEIQVTLEFGGDTVNLGLGESVDLVMPDVITDVNAYFSLTNTFSNETNLT